MQRCRGIIALWLCGFCCAWADEFPLHSGGSIAGELLNRGAPRSEGFLIRTASGFKVRIPQADVAERIILPASEREYERRAPATEDTVAAQWELSEWCRDAKLPHHRTVHLQRILHLEPDHAGARRLLGYRQVGNEWITAEEQRRRDGYEFYRGRWQLVQEIEAQESRSKRELAEREWVRKLRLWRTELHEEKAAAAAEKIRTIHDLAALRPLHAALAKEPEPRVRMLYLDAFVTIGGPAGNDALVSYALKTPHDVDFGEAYDRLRHFPPELAQKKLLESLKSPDNALVNRAARLLERSNDPRTISPLIDVLVTNQRILLPGNGSTNFSSQRNADGTGGAGITKSARSIVEIPVPNRHVLETLVKLTQKNFDYDRRAWRVWYDLEKERLLAEKISLDSRSD